MAPDARSGLSSPRTCPSLVATLGLLALGCGAAPRAGTTLPTGQLAPSTLEPDASLAEAESLLALEGGTPARDLAIGRALAVGGLPELAAFRLGSAASEQDPDLALAGLAWWCTVADTTSAVTVRASIGEDELARVLGSQPREISDCVRELLARPHVEGGQASPLADSASNDTPAGRRTHALALLGAIRSAEPAARLELVRAWAAQRDAEDVERRVMLALAWAEHPPALLSQAGPPFREAVLVAHGIPVCDWDSADATPIAAAISVLAHHAEDGVASLALSLALANHVCGARDLPSVRSSLDPAGLRIPRLRAASDPTCVRGWAAARDEIARQVEDSRSLLQAVEDRMAGDAEWPLGAITDEERADAVDAQLLALARRSPLERAVAASLAPDLEPDAALERVLIALTEPPPLIANARTRLAALEASRARAAHAGPMTRSQSDMVVTEGRALLIDATRRAVQTAARQLLESGELELETLTRIAASAEALPAELQRCHATTPGDDSTRADRAAQRETP